MFRQLSQLNPDAITWNIHSQGSIVIKGKIQLQYGKNEWKWSPGPDSPHARHKRLARETRVEAQGRPVDFLLRIANWEPSTAAPEVVFYL